MFSYNYSNILNCSCIISILNLQHHFYLRKKLRENELITELNLSLYGTYISCSGTIALKYTLKLYFLFIYKRMYLIIMTPCILLLNIFLQSAYSSIPGRIVYILTVIHNTEQNL